MIEKPADGDWVRWANQHYPFDEQWERYLLTRTERPQPGNEKQLDDLRGVRCRSTAATLAELWFRGVEQFESIERERRADRDRDREKDRRRLIRIAGQAFDGKLGETREARETAQATVQRFIGNVPLEQLEYDALRDWEKVHHYTLAKAAGENPLRPTLSRDRAAQAAQKRQMEDLHSAVNAADGQRPVQRSFGGM